MFHRFLIYIIVLLPVITRPLMGANNINGTAGIQYRAVNQVFPKGASLVNGYVRLNNGITVAQEASVAMDTFITVSAGMDIRSTGTVELLSDLYLSSNFTFSTADYHMGAINGRGNTIYMRGNVRLSADKTLRFNGDTIIDGGGNQLIFDAHAQLYVDHGVTLTLRNMQCVINKNLRSRPAIKLGSSKSSLVLQDTDLMLNEDLLFSSGNLFMHGDVVITGSAALIYQSTRPWSITSGAVCLFDNATTCYFCPPAGRNDQLYMADKSAALGFNNATLQTTHTGMRLTRGNLFLDNGVTFSSAGNTRYTDVSLVGSQFIDTNFAAILHLQWSPDGRYVAVFGSDASSWSRISIYAFDGTSLTQKATTTVSFWAITTGLGLQWRADGYYLMALCSGASNEIQIYKFDGSSLTQVGSSIPTNAIFTEIAAAQFDITSNKIVVIGRDGSSRAMYGVYTFNGQSTTLINSGLFPGFSNQTEATALAQSCNGKYFIIAAGTSGAKYALCSLSGGTLTVLGSVVTSGEHQKINGICFTPDDKYAVFSGQNWMVASYLVSDTGLTLQSSDDGDSGGVTGYGYITIHPNGTLLMMVESRNNATSPVREVSLTNGTVAVGAHNLQANFQDNPVVGWRSDGNYVAFASKNNATQGLVGVYRVNFSYDTSTQPFSNGIVLGKASSGASSDIAVQVLGSSRVFVHGKMLYDNAS